LLAGFFIILTINWPHVYKSVVLRNKSKIVLVQTKTKIGVKCNPGATVIISGFVIGLGPESKVVNEFDFEALSANTINCSRVN
jgi:hypothetical protein